MGASSSSSLLVAAIGSIGRQCRARKMLLLLLVVAAALTTVAAASGLHVWAGGGAAAEGGWWRPAAVAVGAAGAVCPGWGTGRWCTGAAGSVAAGGCGGGGCVVLVPGQGVTRRYVRCGSAAAWLQVSAAVSGTRVKDTWWQQLLRQHRLCE